MRYDVGRPAAGRVLPQQALPQLKDALPLDDQVVVGLRLDAHVEGLAQRPQRACGGNWVR